jgi:hypothetical protein
VSALSGRRLARVLASCLLGVSAGIGVSACGGSNAKLIPLANSEPLQSDFEEVAHAAESGGGDCSATEAAMLKTEQDFTRLPTALDAGLRGRLQEGIAKLREDALARCAKALGATRTTSKTTSTRSTPAKTQTTPTTSTETQTTGTQTTPTTSTPTTTNQGGGTQVPEEGTSEQGAGGQGGGTGAGEGVGSGGPRAGEGGPGVGAGGAGQDLRARRHKERYAIKRRREGA